MDTVALYPVIKALHLIFMVTFFAGTFYIVRLFIYHREAEGKFEPERGVLIAQFSLMERKLWYFITWPSMVLMLVFGLWLLWMNPGLLKQPWFQAKLGLIGLLLVYHGVDHSLFNRIQKGQLRWSSLSLRLWNEGATLFLFLVVFLAVLKRVDWQWGATGLVVLGATIALAVMMVRKRRVQKDA